MDRKILFQGTIEGIPLVKFQSEEIIKSTQNGLIYMNSLKYYRDLYKNNKDETIGDPYEGKLFIHDANFQINGEITHIENYAFSTANENDFVYCLFSIYPNNSTFQFGEEIQLKMPKEYDTALVILNSNIFFERINKKAQEDNINIRCAKVNYYDEKKDDISRMYSLLNNGIDSIAFHKRNQYEYQQEYRFTSPKQEGIDHLELNIGSIEDISKVFSVEELFRASVFKQR